MSIYLNGVSHVDLGLMVTEGGPAVAGFPRERTMLSWQGRAGTLPAPVSTTPARVLRLQYDGPTSMTVAQRNTVLQRLSALLTGPVEVQLTDGTARRLHGLCTVYDAAMYQPSFVNVAPRITVEITCPKATLEDLEPAQYILGSTRVRIPIGTAGHFARFYITGAQSSAFSIVYRDFRGTEQGRIECAPSLAAHETLVIDGFSRQFAKYNTSNVGVLVPSWNTTVTWPVMVPRHAQRELALWPTLEASVPVLVRYRRQWEN